ncbi:CPBP family intramembrane glutamic endopeptidase, partial [Staphylococcus aureus]
DIFKSILLLLVLFTLIGFSFLNQKSTILQLIIVLMALFTMFIGQKLNIKLFKRHKYSVRDLVYIIAGYLTIVITDYIYSFFFNITTQNQSEIESIFQHSSLLFLIVTTALLPAILEEYIFRGLILRVIFRNHLLLGVIISSIIFALFHYSDNFFDYIPYFISGLVLSIVYLKTRKIEVAILLHFINNLISAIMLFLNN